MPFSGIGHFLVDLKDDILDFVYPQSCPICRRPLARDERFACTDCWRSLSILPTPFCPYCRCYFGHDESLVEHVCPCLDKAEERAILAIRSLGAFDDSYQKLIHRFKYDKRIPLGRRLAKRLAQTLAQRSDFADCDLVIPVPLHRARHRERGFNQSEILAEGISEATNISLAKDILKRKKNTRDQTHLNAQERAENVRDAFIVTHAANLSGKKVILVDDVMTTGATLKECARILREAGAAKIIAATLAVVVD